MSTLGVASRTPLRESRTRPTGVKSEPLSQPKGHHTGLTCFWVTGALNNSGNWWLAVHPRGVTSFPHSDLSLVLAMPRPHGHGSLSGYRQPPTCWELDPAQVSFKSLDCFILEVTHGFTRENSATGHVGADLRWNLGTWLASRWHEPPWRKNAERRPMELGGGCPSEPWRRPENV